MRATSRDKSPTSQIWIKGTICKPEHNLRTNLPKRFSINILRPVRTFLFLLSAIYNNINNQQSTIKNQGTTANYTCTNKIAAVETTRTKRNTMCSSSNDGCERTITQIHNKATHLESNWSTRCLTRSSISNNLGSELRTAVAMASASAQGNSMSCTHSQP
jgi:hypothetical protein